MSAEFEVTITDKDMFRFNLYHAYHGFQGIIATLVGIWVLAMAGLTFGQVGMGYTVLYIFLGILFLVYVPGNLYLRSKKQVASSDVLRNALHYKIDDTGVHVSQGGQTADLEWKQIYKMVSTKNQLLIYSSRLNAYIIPKEAIGEQYQSVLGLAISHLEGFRLKMNPFDAQ
ncbi:MAG: YcxB family protein [Lachnospiraceae bacterium]|nr:YcxB family protein [Lachnospiraceae bacterium]